ncbi:MAG: DUF3794 domain-containing protein [Lachnospiraceae bacterium]|nr:DUF3794 domain-containing protein [Lachnospiraceae bacterium]
MELIKKNIHMDRIRAEAVSQFTLEDDMNIPESKPDVSSLNLEKGNVIIEEIKPGTDMVMVKGMFNFSILYHTNEEGSSLVGLDGRIPFEEKINMQGVSASDNVDVTGDTEDLTVELINSRKLSIQLIITLNAQIEEVYDEEAPIGIAGAESVEYRKVPVTLAAIAICKNDIFRIKEEVTLPASYPNIFQILWNNISLGDVEFKAMEEKLTVQGDVHLFILYEGEGEEHPIRSFETTLPFSGVLDCHGCREGMLPDIGYRMGQQDITVRPDFDGEERTVGIELVLDIAIHVYEEEETEIISDIYGVSKEVNTVTSKAYLRRLLSKVTGKTKITDHIKAEAGSAGILQLLHSEGKISLERTQAVENGILLQGSLMVRVMYITGDDNSPYAGMKAVIPYEYTLEVPEITEKDLGKVRGDVEQLQVTMLDGEEVDVKAIISFNTTVFRNIPTELIKEVQVTELDMSKQGSLPGMVIYVVKDGDNLWNIGKKYYVPVDKLRRVNNLESDELKKGQKLLVVK